MGHDAGFRDTLPTRSKRGYARLLQEQPRDDCDDDALHQADEQNVNLRKADPDRFP